LASVTWHRHPQVRPCDRTDQDHRRHRGDDEDDQLPDGPDTHKCDEARRDRGQRDRPEEEHTRREELADR
jgi:hypothetical protein